jgi:hypothetical protein
LYYVPGHGDFEHEEITDLHASFAMTLNSPTSSQNLGGIGMIRLASQEQTAKL